MVILTLYPRNNNMKRFSKFMSMFLFVFILLNVNTVSSQDSDYEILVNEKKGFSIEKPDKWVRSDDDTPGKSVMILQGPGIDNFVTSMTFIVENAVSKTPNEHATNLVTQYTKTYKKLEITDESRDPILVNGLTFSSFIIKMNFDGIDYKMRTIFTFKNDKVYQINVIAPERKYDQDIETINKMLKTFKIL